MATSYMDPVALVARFAAITEHWSPVVIGELNGQQVKAAKFLGPFVWHQHTEEDELFLVHRGSFRMEYRDRAVVVRAGEFVIVPRGTEHRPVADAEVEVILFEPASTVRTGDEAPNLAEVLRHRARSAPRSRLIIDMAGGAALALVAYWARPVAWLVVASVGGCLAFYGLWAWADRRLHGLAWPFVRSVETRWRLMRSAAAIGGIASVLLLMFAVLGVALGRIIS